MTTNIDRLWEPARVAASITDGALHATLDDHLRSELAATDAIPERVVCALTDPKPLDICMPVLNAVLAAQYHPLWQVIAGTTIGMLLANVPVVWLGSRFASKLPLKAARIGAALLFAALAIWIALR